ncbi:hypothetical protein AB1J28_15800 [Lysinibacillus irui]
MIITWIIIGYLNYQVYKKTNIDELTRGFKEHFQLLFDSFDKR